MLRKQRGLCAVCRQPEPSGQSLVVDHCHRTKKNRGLLCHACNLGIGKLRDDSTIICAALLYVLRHEKERQE